MTIITLSDPGLQTQPWQWHLQHAIRDISSLGEALQLDLAAVSNDFPLLVPLPFLQRMQSGDLNDPLLRQILPLEEENHRYPQYLDDPLAERHLPRDTRGILQKYQGRILIMTTGACAVNCRYCFRRHFPYGAYQPDKAGWENIINHVQADDSVSEVILSGGDPLVMNDQHLANIIKSIDKIAHIETLRFHTRLPVVIPQRVCDDLLDALSATSKQIVFVLHINHANEIDEDVAAAMRRLASHGITLLNQSVLLRAVNDDDQTLINLSRRLFATGILPYYLHLLDPVSGAAHFDVMTETGIELMKAMTRQLPGYLVPRLVREVPGTDAKQLIYRS